MTLQVERGGRQSRRKGSLAIRFADATGRTPQVASQRLYGGNRLQDDLLAFIRICQEDNRRAELEAFLRPAFAAMNDIEPEPLTDALLVEDAKASAQEQVERSEFQAAKTDAELDDLIKSSLHDAMVSYRVYDAAIAERHRRRANVRP